MTKTIGLLLRVLMIVVATITFSTGSAYAATGKAKDIKKSSKTHTARTISASVKTGYPALTMSDYINLHCKTNCVDQESILKSVSRASRETGVDFRMLLAIVRVESAFKPKAKSGPNVGLAQVNLRYHRKKFDGSDHYNVDKNIDVAAQIYADCSAKHKSDARQSLRCYNGYPRDSVYVNKVMAARKEISRLIDLQRSEENNEYAQLESSGTGASTEALASGNQHFPMARLGPKD